MLPHVPLADVYYVLHQHHHALRSTANRRLMRRATSTRNFNTLSEIARKLTIVTEPALLQRFQCPATLCRQNTSPRSEFLLLYRRCAYEVF